MPEHYFLPKINVSFSAIPKTGCTSLKNYLFALEKDNSGNSVDEATPIEYFEQHIHRPEVMSGFRVKTLQHMGPARSLRILVLRNPYNRILSAWANKLLFAQHDFRIFDRLSNESFTPVDFSSIQELNQAFERFTERLFSDSEFLQSDVHWQPQVEFFDNVSDYDVVFETSALGGIQSVVEMHLASQGRTSKRHFPHFNATTSSLVSQIGTRAAWDYVRATYKEDLEALKIAGIATMMPDEENNQREPISHTELEQEKTRILESRRRSEVRSLRVDLANHDFIKRRELQKLEDQIREIKASRSWRLTAWLRWISAPFLKGR